MTFRAREELRWYDVKQVRNDIRVAIASCPDGLEHAITLMKLR